MPFPAATLTSNTTHGPPVVGVGCPTVLIGGKPAWRVTDQHTCPVPNAPPPVGPGSPHGPGVTAPPGTVTVLVGGPQLARVSDQVVEAGAVQPPVSADPIMMGVITVLVP